MLRIYICPTCYNIRMVSRKPDAVCLHCGMRLHKSDLEYADFMNMTEEERNLFKEKYKSRMISYNELKENSMALIQQDEIKSEIKSENIELE